ncbi:IS3 family element, transposase orfB [Klebsiella pneumoniae]|nr:IS3 family element, transposase orfB [Klebsiella pneumoniae]
MQSRTVYHWQSRRDDRAITLRIREIAETRIRYGCPRIHIQLRREGWPVNHKKTHRIYCLEGLNLRKKRPRRHVSAAHRQQRPVLSGVDQCWSMDFVSDNLFNGRRFRALTVVDNFSRECVAIHAGKSLKGEDVVGVMERLRVLASACRYVFRQITAASLSRKVWINGRMSTVLQWTSLAPENQRITRLLNHLTAVCGMNA